MVVEFGITSPFLEVRLCHGILSSWASFGTVAMLLPWNNIYVKLEMNELAQIVAWVSHVGFGIVKGLLMD